MSPSRSLVVLLSHGGAELDARAVNGVPCGKILRVEFAWGGPAACVALTLEHEVSHAALVAQLEAWARGRGWSVTIAPLHRVS